MDGLLLRVVLHNIDNRETVHSEQVFIRSIPNSASSSRRVVQVHTHTELLRSLTSEDVGGGRLSDFSGSVNYLLATPVSSLNLDDHISISHSGVRELDAQFVEGEDHIHKRDVVPVNHEKRCIDGHSQDKIYEINSCNDALRLALSDDSLNVLVSGRD